MYQVLTKNLRTDYIKIIHSRVFMQVYKVMSLDKLMLRQAAESTLPNLVFVDEKEFYIGE